MLLARLESNTAAVRSPGNTIKRLEMVLMIAGLVVACSGSNSENTSGDAGGFECLDPWDGHALGAEAAVAGPVELAVCLQQDGERPVRVDRTGPELCTPESASTPCPTAGCSHACLTNDDCGGGSACLCAFGIDKPAANPIHAWQSVCLLSECESEADCAGYACGFSRERCGPIESSPSPAGFFCRTPNDECQTDADCGDGNSSRCVYRQEVMRWVCSPVVVACD